MSEIFKALVVQARVVYAFILRDMRTRFGRSRLGYFWAVFEPLTGILALALVFSVIDRGSPINVDIHLFFFTGIIPWTLFSRGVSMMSNVIEGSVSLLTYPQVKVIDVVIARVVLEFATIFIVCILYLTVLYFWDIFDRIENLLLSITVLMICLIFGSAFGLVGAVIKLYLPGYSSFQGLLLRVLFFVSGAFFVADSMPQPIRDALWYNPVLHLVEWARSAFFYGFESRFYDPMYPILWMLCFGFLGLAGERVTRSKLRQLGV
ncbi:ABC transporter permease [uncultured Thiothrix sp.]|uniref:ABC transporter permease n=1 Tax=uncultured Thiothrix sp. TaxID=223185 RepID=UPI00261FACB4|nr:ABC transporter permease [uncultured Thiothrix sp.]HMT92604.1 ABC transporter permease [Thiolinea sp.]